MKILLASVVVSAITTGLFTVLTAWLKRTGDVKVSRIANEPSFAKQVQDLMQSNAELMEQNKELISKNEELQRELIDIKQQLSDLTNGGKVNE